jgi:hypothetical protein
MLTQYIASRSSRSPRQLNNRTVGHMHLAADGLAGVSLHCEAYCEGLSGPQPSQGRASLQLLPVGCGYDSLGRAPSALSSILHAALMLTALSWYDVALQSTLPNLTVAEFLYSARKKQILRLKRSASATGHGRIRRAVAKTPAAVVMAWEQQSSTRSRVQT